MNLDASKRNLDTLIFMIHLMDQERQLQRYAACESTELARARDDPMSWYYKRNGISMKRLADGA